MFRSTKRFDRNFVAPKSDRWPRESYASKYRVNETDEQTSDGIVELDDIADLEFLITRQAAATAARGPLSIRGVGGRHTATADAPADWE